MTTHGPFLLRKSDSRPKGYELLLKESNQAEGDHSEKWKTNPRLTSDPPKISDSSEIL